MLTKIQIEFQRKQSYSHCTTPYTRRLKGLGTSEDRMRKWNVADSGERWYNKREREQNLRFSGFCDVLAHLGFSHTVRWRSGFAFH